MKKCHREYDRPRCETDVNRRIEQTGANTVRYPSFEVGRHATENAPIGGAVELPIAVWNRSTSVALLSHDAYVGQVGQPSGPHDLER